MCYKGTSHHQTSITSIEVTSQFQAREGEESICLKSRQHCSVGTSALYRHNTKEALKPTDLQPQHLHHLTVGKISYQDQPKKTKGWAGCWQRTAVGYNNSSHCFLSAAEAIWLRSQRYSSVQLSSLWELLEQKASSPTIAETATESTNAEIKGRWIFHYRPMTKHICTDTNNHLYK